MLLLMRNIPGITTLQILDPNGVPVSTVLGTSFSVPNVAYAGTYTCVIRNILNNSTVSTTSKVIV